MNSWISAIIGVIFVLMLTVICCKKPRVAYAILFFLCLAGGANSLITGSIGGSGGRYTLGPTSDPIAVYGVSTLVIAGGIYFAYLFIKYPKELKKTAEQSGSANPPPPSAPRDY